MKVALALRSVSHLFLDTAPVIYLVEKNPVYLDVVRAIFQEVDSGRLTAVTSPVTLAECLVHPVRHSLPQLRQTFIDVIVTGANTIFVALEQQVGLEAARLRATYNLSLTDALQIAAALVNGCDAFLTNDLKLKRVTEITMLVVGELEV